MGHRLAQIFSFFKLVRFLDDPRQLQGSSWEKWLEAKVQTGVLNETKGKDPKIASMAIPSKSGFEDELFLSTRIL